MVGFDKERAKTLKQYDYMFAGGVSGFITRATCQPLDVLKIRFQLQVEPIRNVLISKYHSVPQGLALICKEEGLKSLWKGHVPAQLLSVVYGLVKFGSLEALTKEAHYFGLHKKNKTLVNFGCGALAGCAATVASFPFDVARTRLVAQGENVKLYSGVVNVFGSILRNESVIVLYRGLFPTFIQVAPFAGVQFMSYKIFDGIYRSFINLDHSAYTFSGSLIAGSLSGLVAKTAIYPLDLVKKRMQIQGVEQHRKEFGKIFICNGMIDCIRKIYIHEGFFGLFKGLNPSLIKAVCTAAIHFTSYEMILKGISDLRT